MSQLPATMKSWVKSRAELGGFDLVNNKLPRPKSNEVLVKTHSTSICGTDIHIWKWDDWARENVPLGTITGHETCGTIVGVGEVTSHKIGDKIAVECHLACWNVIGVRKETHIFAKADKYLASIKMAHSHHILLSHIKMPDIFQTTFRSS